MTVGGEEIMRLILRARSRGIDFMSNIEEIMELGCIFGTGLHPTWHKSPIISINVNEEAELFQIAGIEVVEMRIENDGLIEFEFIFTAWWPTPYA